MRPSFDGLFFVSPFLLYSMSIVDTFRKYINHEFMTVRVLVVVLFVTFLPAKIWADTYPKNHNIDILHYAFHITLSDESDEIIGKAIIDVGFKEVGIDEVRLDFINQSDALENKGMSIGSVLVNGKEVSYAHTGDIVLIQLGNRAQSKEQIQITISYKGVPATGLIIGPNKHGDRTFFSDNWPNKARNWLPTVDHPYDKATCEFIVTAPSKYKVVSNGLIQEESILPGGRKLTHWKQSVPISNWLYVLGVAEFAVQYVDEFEGKSIQTWVYKQDREDGFYDFAPYTKDVLQYYTDNVGPFAYEKLANIQSNSVGGGMEAASAILYGDKSVTGERTTRWKHVIIHEIAHQWFGNMVTEADWDDVWLSEGFATYFTLLYREHAYGVDDFKQGLLDSKELIKKYYTEEPNFRIVHDDLDDMSKVVSYGGTYQKGAWVLHMLRSKIGDEAFWKGIRQYHKENYNANTTVENFKSHMEKASEENLDGFFDQWLYKEGNPSLDVVWTYNPKKEDLTINVRQVQVSSTVFAFPLKVKVIYDDGSSKVERMEVNASKQKFSIPSDKKPMSIELDPSVELVADWVVKSK